MNLTSKIFKIFTFIFIAQLTAVGLWAFSLYSSKDGQYPTSVVDALSKVDRSIIEGIILQNKIGSPLARDLVAYKLLELNNVDSAEYLEPQTLPNLISSLRLQNCTNNQEITICSKSDNKVAISLIPLKIADNLEGYLKLEKSLKVVAEVNKKVLFTIGMTVLVVFLINAFTLIMIWWKFLRPETSKLIRVIENQTEDTTILISEYKKIQDSFLEAISRVKESESEKTLLMSQLQRMNLATQVAHDIRSPLEVLKGLKDEMTNLPETSRKRVQLTINRIEEITFNLLKTHKQSVGIDSNQRPEELLSLITSVVTEKCIEYRNNSGIDIFEELDSNSYGLFSKIQRSTLKSIISNLINNSIESFAGKSGVITIGLTTKGDKNVIRVSDNGLGILPEARNKIFTKGFTTKTTGNGLGLFNAKQDLEEVGGTIEFESEIGKGTTFTIALPKSEAPPTFIGSIDVYKYERIIVLDDDPAFHEVWNKRLEGLESKVEHIHSVEEMFSKYQVLHPKILLLSDFELMDKHLDGVDTILKLGHSEHSVLVTARNEEQAIQDRCLAAGIKLLPKSLVNFIKVDKELSESSQAQLGSASMVGESVVGFAHNFKSDSDSKALKFDVIAGAQGHANEAYNEYVEEKGSRSSDTLERQNPKPSSAGEKYGIYIQGGQAGSADATPIILIDDDKLVHINWKTYCKKNQLDFQSFKSIDEFLKVATTLDKASRIYIDSNLGDGIKGEIESEKIFALGFLNLYLATGYETDSILKPSWIKEVYSKSPRNIV